MIIVEIHLETTVVHGVQECGSGGPSLEDIRWAEAQRKIQNIVNNFYSKLREYDANIRKNKNGTYIDLSTGKPLSIKELPPEGLVCKNGLFYWGEQNVYRCGDKWVYLDGAGTDYEYKPNKSKLTSDVYNFNKYCNQQIGKINRFFSNIPSGIYYIDKEGFFDINTDNKLFGPGEIPSNLRYESGKFYNKSFGTEVEYDPIAGKWYEVEYEDKLINKRVNKLPENAILTANGYKVPGDNKIYYTDGKGNYFYDVSIKEKKYGDEYHAPSIGSDIAIAEFEFRKGFVTAGARTIGGAQSLVLFVFDNKNAFGDNNIYLQTKEKWNKYEEDVISDYNENSLVVKTNNSYGSASNLLGQGTFYAITAKTANTIIPEKITDLALSATTNSALSAESINSAKKEGKNVKHENIYYVSRVGLSTILNMKAKSFSDTNYAPIIYSATGAGQVRIYQDLNKYANIQKENEPLSTYYDWAIGGFICGAIDSKVVNNITKNIGYKIKNKYNHIGLNLRSSFTEQSFINNIPSVNGTSQLAFDTISNAAGSSDFNLITLGIQNKKDKNNTFFVLGTN